MPQINIPFEPDLNLSYITKKLEVIYRPYIFIELSYKGKTLKNQIRSLVDSGADYNVFPSSFARELGIDIEKGPKRKITGIGGQSFYAYAHEVNLKIEAKKLKTIIFFGEQTTTPLLGRHGFFNCFKKVKFDVNEKMLQLKY